MTTQPRTRQPRPPRPPHPLRVAFDALPPAEQQAILERLQQLLAAQQWVFAKTMPENPHEYSVRKTWARDEDFVWTVEQIRGLGYRQKYGKNYYTQLDVGEFFYWTMGWPINTKTGAPLTIILNRKPVRAKLPAADAGSTEPNDHKLA